MGGYGHERGRSAAQIDGGIRACAGGWFYQSFRGVAGSFFRGRNCGGGQSEPVGCPDASDGISVRKRRAAWRCSLRLAALRARVIEDGFGRVPGASPQAVIFRAYSPSEIGGSVDGREGRRQLDYRNDLCNYWGAMETTQINEGEERMWMENPEWRMAEGGGTALRTERHRTCESGRGLPHSRTLSRF